MQGVGLRGFAAPPAPLDMGNAGTAMRLFMGLLAAQPFDSELIGDESLMRRPMERVAKPLREMGARIETVDGTPAGAHLAAARALHGIDYAMPVASAQVKSAMLLAGLYARGRDDGASSRPSRATTPSACCRRFGCEVVARSRHGHVAAAGAARGGQRRRARRLLVGRVLHRRGLHRRARAVRDPGRRRQSDAHRACSRCWR